MTKDNNFKPIKEKEYRDFLLWQSLPSFLFKMDQERLDLMNLDEEILSLLDVKTQKEFAKKYGLEQGTLCDWKNNPIPEEYRDINWRVWAKRLTKNVVGALYRQALIDGDAARAKLWFQLIEDWKEGFEVDQNIRSEIEGTRNKLKDILLDEREKTKSDSVDQAVSDEQPTPGTDGWTA